MKKILFILLCTAIFIVLAAIWINAKDEQLNPDILPLLTWERKPTDNNSYYMLLGFSALENRDPETYAREQIKRYEAGEEVQQENSPTVQDDNDILCEMSEDKCFVSYLEKAQELFQVITENQVWLQRYLLCID